MGWSDHNWGTETCDNWCNFLNFANFNQFLEIASCCHFRRPTDIVLDFFLSSDAIFYVGNKVCARWNQRVHKKLKKDVKREFSEHFFVPKSEHKSKMDQNATRETILNHICFLICFLNITILMSFVLGIFQKIALCFRYFLLMQNWQNKKKQELPQFFSHIYSTTSQRIYNKPGSFLARNHTVEKLKFNGILWYIFV